MDRRSIIFILLMTVGFFLIQEWLFPPTTPPLKVEEPKKVIQKSEELYVLSNEYTQLVFSKEGSLKEINLSFKPKIVKPIDIDRTLAKEDKAPFPSSPYHVYNKDELENPVNGGYYPLIRRDIPKKLYALNFVGEDFEKSSTRIKRFEKDLIEFEITTPLRKITKTFYFDNKSSPYSLNMGLKVEGNSKNLQFTTGVLEAELIMDSASFECKGAILKNNELITENIDLPKTYLESSSTNFQWLALSNGFFGIIVQPNEAIPNYRLNFVEAPSRLNLINNNNEKYPAYDLILPVTKAAANYKFYLGPLDDKMLKLFNQECAKENYKPNFEEITSSSGFMSSISSPFAKILFWMMKGFYFITHSWGISILLLTIALRIILYPLNNWSIKSQQKMQEVSPKIKAVQERYKSDPKRVQMEMMKIYKEHGGNPLAGGCLPMLIQLPILIGIFTLLKSSFVLRGVVFIPGWINNLAAPDVLFSWNYSIILIGNQLHLLPILLGAVTFVQQRFFSSIPMDAKQMTDQQKQQVVMGNFMTIFLIFIFYKMPSGLNIYYFFSTVLGIAQQWYVNKKAKV